MKKKTKCKSKNISNNVKCEWIKNSIKRQRWLDWIINNIQISIGSKL